MRSKQDKGFTLIELTLAITFLSILLLGILYTTIHAGKIYAKGISYKSVNQVSREIVDTIRRDFIAVNASSVVLPPLSGASPAQSGRFCTGQVSYVWNTAALLATSDTKIQDGATSVVFRRVVDPGGTLCIQDVPGHYPMSIFGMQSSEMLSTNGRDLAAYTFQIKVLKADGAHRGLYQIRMTMGTNEQGTTILDPAGGYICRPPTDNTANFEYCTVVDFDTIIRAGGNP